MKADDSLQSPDTQGTSITVAVRRNCIIVPTVVMETLGVSVGDTLEFCVVDGEVLLRKHMVRRGENEQRPNR